MSRKWSSSKHAWFIDERDGLRKKLRRMRKDGYSKGLKVARDTYDRPEPQEKKLRDISDPQSLRDGTGDADRASQLSSVLIRQLDDRVGPLHPELIIHINIELSPYELATYTRVTPQGDIRVTPQGDTRVTAGLGDCILL